PTIRDREGAGDLRVVRFLGGLESVEANAVSREDDALTFLERGFGVHRPGLRARHAERHDEDAEVDDEAAVAPVLVEEQAPGGAEPPARMATSCTNAAVEIEHHGPGDEDHQSHAEQHERIADTDQPQDRGSEEPSSDWREEVPP